MTHNFTDQVAIISGGASGIGRETAVLLAERGARAIVVADFDATRGPETAAEIEACGTQALFVHTDVTNEDQVVSMVKKAQDTYGRIDMLLNAAGGPVCRNSFVDCTLETWESCMAQNLRGTFLCAREAVKFMLERGKGSIVNIASVAAYLGNPGHSVHYAAAKGGILSLTIGMGREFAAQGIRVNAVSPGPFDTPFQDKFATPESIKRVKERVPAARLGDPREAAELICFLLSDASPYVTGTTVRIDGAMTG